MKDQKLQELEIAVCVWYVSWSLGLGEELNCVALDGAALLGEKRKGRPGLNRDGRRHWVRWLSWKTRQNCHEGVGGQSAMRMNSTSAASRLRSSGSGGVESVQISCWSQRAGVGARQWWLVTPVVVRASHDCAMNWWIRTLAGSRSWVSRIVAVGQISGSWINFQFRN